MRGSSWFTSGATRSLDEQQQAKASAGGASSSSSGVATSSNAASSSQRKKAVVSRTEVLYDLLRSKDPMYFRGNYANIDYDRMFKGTLVEGSKGKKRTGGHVDPNFGHFKNTIASEGVLAELLFDFTASEEWFQWRNYNVLFENADGDYVHLYKDAVRPSDGNSITTQYAPYAVAQGEQWPCCMPSIIMEQYVSGNR